MLQDEPSTKTEFSLSNARELLEQSLGNMFAQFIDMLPNLVIASFVLVATFFATRIFKRIYRRVIENRKLRPSLKDLIAKLVTVAIWCVGLLASAAIVFPSIDPSSILAGLGLSSIAIGFAFKDVVENFFAGFLILIRDPLEIGDFIECQEVRGKVEEITIRDTLIRQVDGQRVIVPNAMLFKNPVNILTDKKTRRVTIMCGVAYDTDLAQARDVIQKAVEGCSSRDGEVQVFANAFGASSIDFEVAWWTGSTPLAVRRSRDEVVEAIKRALDDAGIEIPFPQRTLWFKEPLAVSKGGADEGEAS